MARHRRFDIGLGCPRCGGSTTRVSKIAACRKCGWHEGEQNLDAPRRTSPEELPIDFDNPFPGKRRTPLNFGE